MRTALTVSSLLLAAFSGYGAHSVMQPADKPAQKDGDKAAEPSIPLGNFSVSLTVKDIAASRAFYEKLGFHIRGGNEKQKWLVMQNDTATIGLFQGMFEKNSLTFNPGWDRNKNTLPDFQDVRDLQKTLEARGLTLKDKAAADSTGPAFITLLDPDGNPILIDQHVPRPGTPAPAPAKKP